MTAPGQKPETAAEHRKRWRHLPHLGRFRYSAIELLVVLALFILAAPLIDDLPRGELLESLLMTLVMVSGVFAVGSRRETYILAFVIVAPALLGRWASAFLGADVIPAPVYLVPTIIFFGWVIWNVLRFVHTAPRVDSTVLCAGVSAYLMLGLLWAPAYLLVGSFSPDSFSISGPQGSSEQLNNFTALYFSFTTLSTLGFGDVLPLRPVARMLAMSEATMGLLFMAVLIARLVAMHTADPLDRPKS